MTLVVYSPASWVIRCDFLDENLPLVEVDSTQIRQVIMNLIINAAEAIDHSNLNREASTYKLPLFSIALSQSKL